MAKPKKEKCYINGELIPTKEYSPVINPYNGEVIAQSPVADIELLERAMSGASDVFKSFALLARYERAEMLHKIANGIEKEKEEFSRLICREGGKPITLARGEVNRVVITCRYAAEEAIRFGGDWLPLDIHPGTKDFTGLLGRVPLGPVLAISPFNFPLNLVMHKLAPAIAVGCPIIIKPSSETPLTALKLASVCHRAGVPAGSVNVVPCPGQIFERLVVDDRPRMLSFTGSDTVGWRLKEIAGRKRVTLELGGNAAAVVHEDADLKFAAERIAFGGFAHAGQICISVQRVIIHESVYDEFVRLLIRETKKLKCGDPGDEGVIVGPMITSKEADRVEEWEREAQKSGAKYLVKGCREGSVLTPSILSDVPRNAKLNEREAFGPVVIVERYRNWVGKGGAIDRVNDSKYGLQAGIFTSDINLIMKAYQELEVGAVIVNDVPTTRVDNYPYGGTKGSGQGREGVRCAMNEMTEERVLVLRIQ
ncbi:MAG: aldehyde dehydrogenase family protein [bacterium]|nr:aldehyde dehydrogenase family protein [bacterium]